MTVYRVNIGSKEVDARLIARSSDSICYEVNGKIYDVRISAKAENFAVAGSRETEIQAAPVRQKSVFSAKNVVAPMPGLVTKIFVKEGDKVQTGDALLVMEAMKMENKISAPKDAVIKKILVTTGKEVMAQEVLIELS